MFSAYITALGNVSSSIRQYCCNTANCNSPSAIVGKNNYGSMDAVMNVYVLVIAAILVLFA